MEDRIRPAVARPVRAAFGRRLAAFVLDACAILLLAFGALLVITAVLGPSAFVDLDDPAAAEVRVSTARATLNAIAVAAVSGIYFVATWRAAGATPSQRLLGLRVHSWPDRGTGGDALSMPAAVVRWALLGAPLGIASALALDAPLAFLAISVGSFVWFVALVVSTALTGRGLHDRLSGSQVVHDAGR